MNTMYAKQRLFIILNFKSYMSTLKRQPFYLKTRLLPTHYWRNTLRFWKELRSWSLSRQRKLSSLQRPNSLFKKTNLWSAKPKGKAYIIQLILYKICCVHVHKTYVRSCHILHMSCQKEIHILLRASYPPCVLVTGAWTRHFTLEDRVQPFLYLSASLR